MILLDNDHFTVAVQEEFSGHHALATKLRAVTEEVGLPIISVEESLRGWLAQIHRAKTDARRIEAYDHLMELIGVLPNWRIVRWDEIAAHEYSQLRRSRVSIPPHDLMIASLTITHDALLLTRNAKDFSRVPGLRFESWLD